MVTTQLTLTLMMMSILLLLLLDMRGKHDKYLKDQRKERTLTKEPRVESIVDLCSTAQDGSL